VLRRLVHHQHLGGILLQEGTDPPGTSVSYTTAPLGSDLDLAGIPSVAFRVDAPTFSPNSVRFAYAAARGTRRVTVREETFDFDGYEALLKRLRAGDSDVAIPVFDRSIELSRAAAAIVPRQVALDSLLNAGFSFARLSHSIRAMPKLTTI
jgi:hypothetical protein